MNKAVSIIIPTFNERDNIIPLVERISRALSDYEIVFIDDDSRDGTAELAMTLSATYPVRVSVRKDKKGLASAVVDGLGQVDSEVIGVLDADLQHPPEVLAELLREVKSGADLVVASRYVKGGSCQGWGLTRRIISKGAIFLAHLFLPQTRPVSDPMSGFFMLKRQVVNGADLRPTGYKILLEILIAGHFDKVAEVPYAFNVRERGESKLSARQQVDYLKHLYRLMSRTGEVIRFLKFVLVGGSGIGVNLGSYWLMTRFLHLNQFAALAISFEASVVSNFLFNNFFTFSDRRVSKPLPFLVQFVKFNIISLGGLGIQEGSLWLLNSVLQLNDIFAVFIGIVLATLWNYLVNTWWTWK